MAKQKQWNNQGGSGRGDKPKRDKKQLPNIPSFDKLPESNTVSFRIIPQRKPSPDYGQFGDDIYTDWQLLGEPDPRIPEYEDLRIDDVKDISDRDLDLSIDRIRTPPLITNTEFSSEIKSKDLLPKEAYKEYEITVKYKKLILTILSGQAYASRNNLNNPLLDFSIVIISSEAIQIDPNPPGTLNIIQRVGSAQDPMFAVYNWVLDKLKLVTDNKGKGADDTLRRLPRRGVLPIPPTSFNWNNDTWNLFGGQGKEPTQICLHATNDLVKFEPSTPKNAAFLWSVLVAGDPLPLCKSLLPFISIELAPGGSENIEFGSGANFVLRIGIDSIQDVDIDVEILIAGNQQSFPFNFTILAQTEFTDISFAPWFNPTQPQNILVTLVEDLEKYNIDENKDRVELTVLPKSIPVVGFNPSLSFIQNAVLTGEYQLCISISIPFIPIYGTYIVFEVIMTFRDRDVVTGEPFGTIRDSTQIRSIFVDEGTSNQDYFYTEGNRWEVRRVRANILYLAYFDSNNNFYAWNEGSDFNYTNRTIDISY